MLEYVDVYLKHERHSECQMMIVASTGDRLISYLSLRSALSTHHSLLQSVSCGSSNKSLRSVVSWSDPSQYLDSFLQHLLHTITSIWEFNARVWKYGWPMENHGAWPSQVRNYKTVFKTNPKLLIFILIMNRFRKLKTREDMLDYHKRIPWSMLVCIRERFVCVHFHFM